MIDDYPPPIVRGVRVIEVQDRKLARAEIECTKPRIGNTPGEYDVVLYVHGGKVNGETRPEYILALRAQALDEVQELIQPGDQPWVDPPLPTQEQWDRIVTAAFPPPPMAGA